MKDWQKIILTVAISFAVFEYGYSSRDNERFIFGVIAIYHTYAIFNIRDRLDKKDKS